MLKLVRPLVAPLVALAVVVVAAPAPAQAQGYGPSYVFSNVGPITSKGPCYFGMGNSSIGDVGPAGFIWSRSQRTSHNGPNIRIEYRTENAFRKIITSNYCRDGRWWRQTSGHPSYKVSRINEYHQTCYGDRCYPIGTTVPQGYYEKPWQAGWR